VFSSSDFLVDIRKRSLDETGGDGGLRLTWLLGKAVRTLQLFPAAEPRIQAMVESDHI